MKKYYNNYTFNVYISESVHTPNPFKDHPLGEEPAWENLKAAMLEFNTTVNTVNRPNSKGCQLPKLDPWDPSILSWVKDWPAPYDKKAGIEDLLYINRDKLYFNTTWLKNLTLSRGQVSCKYSYYGAWPSALPDIQFDENIVTLLPNYNSIWTSCSHGKKQLSEITLFYVPPLGSKQVLTESAINPYMETQVPRNMTGRRYSITNLIIDSLSQMNIFRSLPKSLAQAEAMGGILMSGHHKVGDNSLPNVMAMVTGDELYWTLMRWITTKGKDPETLPMIIGMFRDWGWNTVLFEDMLNWGGSAMKYNTKISNPWNMTYNDVWRHLKDSTNHNNPIKTVMDMHLTYKDIPSVIHTHLSEYLHNNINMAKNYDEDIAAMLTNLSNENILDETFFLIMGDHGYRGTTFSNLKQGMIENNMPGLIIIPPKHFAERHPDWHKNLKANSNVLTSHYDIHHMFRDILGLAGGREEIARAYKDLKKFGASLFSPLGRRSCTEAGVLLEFCSCPDGHITLDPSSVETIAEAVLKDINIFLTPLWGCRTLKLANITSALMKTEWQTVTLEAVLVITIEPVVYHMSLTNSGSKTFLSLTRSDRYSKTSHCVPKADRGAVPYCICPPE